MAVMGIDIGGTKVSIAVFSSAGEIISSKITGLGKRNGDDAGDLINDLILTTITSQKQPSEAIHSIGIAVPGISYQNNGTVWAPNIPGWEQYPLLEKVREVSGSIPVTIDSDRACYILGECWKGNAQGCKDVIFLSVGTGIGAGILVNGNILRGAHDIAGAIGWMALDRPFTSHYISCGCFEYHASGEGIAKKAREYLELDASYSGELRNIKAGEIIASDIFAAYEKHDPLAEQILQEAIDFWAMAVANLVSLFNPEKIIVGGGVFGPAVQFLSAIKSGAFKWAQPISIRQVSLENSLLKGDAGVYGAGFLALQNVSHA